MHTLIFIAMMASSTPCIENMPETATLGIGLLHCRGGKCAVNGEVAGIRAHRFTIEPSIWEIDPRGPAKELREGDQIVSIDDVLITTREGGRRLANLTPNVPVRLRMRRGDREFLTTLVPVRGCNTPKITVTNRSFTGRPPSPSGNVPPAVDFGMTLECADCGWHAAGDGLVWYSSEPLHVVEVLRDGPADRAGIKAGDTIVSVDGYALPGREGGIYLGSIKPGQVVMLGRERGGRTDDVRITPAARAGRL